MPLKTPWTGMVKLAPVFSCTVKLAEYETLLMEAWCVEAVTLVMPPPGTSTS